MSDEFPPCPECQSPYVYEMGALLICPECAHEWAPGDGGSDEAGSDDNGAAGGADAPREVRDAAGNVLSDGDAVTVAKDLRVKGGGTIKAGTKVKSIRLVDGHDGHDIDCRIDGFGPMQLKSSVVKRA
ncbi:alkylphosphonate utilization protein [Leucobacter sp. CSA1]|uniref:Alkylphosphonate utilization protein n=1 Tax=Leucobacter chromiisoli TaxID=2796471 RepID=A0A934Q3Y3_9MICO|nr:zinc ribbon domain-containing protein YjdM [Leucobacter chromiisoli]MBK0417929.1 alkylphosphonate utilization protein [Leucobacter chromiisoli]